MADFPLTPPRTPSSRSLAPAVAIIALIGVLLFFALRVAFNPIPVRPTTTPVIVTRTPLPTLTVTLTPTVTPTETRTPRPTWTLQPTPFPTPTVTPSITPLPSRLPYLATPVLATPYKYNDLYLLKTWTPEEADALIQTLQGIPVARYPVVSQQHSAAFDRAFAYAAYAQREALRRFPDAPQAEAWRWSLAYNATRLQEPQAGQLLADLLHGMPFDKASLDNLPQWFAEQQDRLLQERPMALAVIEMPTGHVIEITSAGGAAYLWLPQGAALATPFTARFDYALGLQSHLLSGDLTGDDIPELVVDFTFPTATTVTQPEVFRLDTIVTSLAMSQTVPIALETVYESRWAIIPQNDGLPVLRFNGFVFPACPVTVEQGYRWQGEHLVFEGETSYHVLPNADQLYWCERVLDHGDLHWDPQAVIPLYETLIPLWPPAADARGRLYPADARDALRYRLGLNLALANRTAAARAALEDLIANPTTPESEWIAPAQDFLAAYETPAEIYRACQQAPHCNPRAALKALTVQQKAHDPTQTWAFLKQQGVIMRSAGIFDFDGDGADERWLTVRHHPQEALEFWILAGGPQGVQALFVQSIEDGSPRPYSFEPLTTPRITQFERGSGFILHRVPAQAGYIEHVETQFIYNTDTLKGLQAAVQSLFNGAEPATIVRQLEILQDMPNFNCRDQCDRFWYTYALALELSDQPGAAIDAYIKLWWEHLRSPFTMMARAKLTQLRLTRTDTPIPTQTPTITLTPTPSLTPTITQTPTVTHTIDPNATATETPTVTPTATETPTETPTPTPTETPTS
ncbi:MAG: hypothetical protein ACOYYS_22075 [Chloroflexota bacterium]